MRAIGYFLFFSLVLFGLSGCGSQGDSFEVLPEETSTIDDDIEEIPATPPPDTVAVGFSSPGLDENFALLPNGKKLLDLSVSGRRLSLSKGTGTSFTEEKWKAYKDLKRKTMSDSAHQVQWALMDLDRHAIVERSLSSTRKIFGASSSKIYVASALLNYQNGSVSTSQLQLMAEMLVVSSNSAWTDLQSQIGGGSSNKGRELIHKFTQNMGYERTRAFQGTWGDLHGNELVAAEAVETLYDIYTGRFPGAEYVWKLMHACRTGAQRGRKYIPKNVYVGGKTGTYDGPTVDPESGQPTSVHVRNHILVFNVGGRQFGLAVLANSGSDESAALLAGGLLREHASLED